MDDTQQRVAVLRQATPFDEETALIMVESPYSHGGLAVTPYQIWSGESSKWVITHIASGKHISDFETIIEAKTALIAILPLADWTQGEGELKHDATLEDRIDAALKAVAPEERP